MSLTFAVALALAAQGKPPPESGPPPLEPPPIVAVPSPPPPIVPMLVPPAPPAPPAPRPAPVRPPEPAVPLIYYFSTDDYPASALRNEQQGTTAFRLTVGANGRVSDCTILSTSGSAALDTATCSILRRRARFTPARDALGNPVEGGISSRVRWVLPPPPSRVIPDVELLAGADGAADARQPRPLHALAALFAAADYPAEAIAAATLPDTEVALTVAADGRVAGCRVAAASGLAALDAAACRVLGERARFAPGIDVYGSPVEAVLAIRIRWREDPDDDDALDEPQ